MTTSSPRARRIRCREFVRLAFEVVGIDDWQRYVRQDPKFFGQPRSTCWSETPSKARNELGWVHEVTFPELVRKMVTHDLDVEGRSNGVSSNQL